MHVITGQIRKTPFTKEGSNHKGGWKMYAVELSESWKDFKTQERQYTNYRATLFASSPGAIQYYDEVLVQAAIVSISSETLLVNQREHEGKVYITLEPVQPRLMFAKAPEHASQQSQQPSGGVQQARNQLQRSSSSNYSPSDSEIPF